MPNLLVGAGLLFTFLGLAAALGTAGGVVAGEAAARNDALRLLLETAAFKFVTSLFGMLLSILYALIRKDRLKRIESTLDRFLIVLEERVPIVTIASLQHDQIALLERQGVQMETFSNDLAVALGSAIDQSFNERLAEHVAPLTEAMERLSANMGSRNEEVMQTMLDGFVKRLEGGAGNHMQGVAETLSGLGERLEGLQSGLGDAAVRMAQSADAMATRMGEGAEAALGRITDQMGGLAESLRLIADQTREAGAQAGGAMAERIATAASGFEEAARAVATTLAEAAATMERRMGEQASESSVRLGAQLEAMLGEMRALAEASRSAGTEAFTELANRVGAASAGFEITSARVAEALERAASETGGAFGRGATDAISQVTAATESMREEIRAMAEASRVAGAEAFGGLAERVVAAAAGFESTSARVAEALQQAASQTGGTFGRGAEDAVARIAAATEGMREEMHAMLGELRASVGEAGEALRTGSIDSASAMRSTIDSAAGALATTLEGASTRLAMAGAEAGTALERGGSSAGLRLVSASTEAGTAIEGAGSTAGNVLARSAEEAGSALERGVSSAAERLRLASSALGDGAGALATQIASLQASGSSLAERITAFERAAAAAAAPLAGTATDLKAAGEAARAAVEPLAQTGQSVARAMEGVAGAAQRLDSAAAQAGLLVTSLDVATKRFEGVDQGLARTMKGLQEGLKDFTQQISEFVVKTDGNLAKAATQLGQLVKSLEDTLEDYAPAPARAVGR